MLHVLSVLLMQYSPLSRKDILWYFNKWHICILFALKYYMPKRPA
jgi:hypothetical protein